LLLNNEADENLATNIADFVALNPARATEAPSLEARKN
jgi:hypothetical protein